MRIDWATERDYNYLVERDHHLLERLIMSKINAKEIYILREAEDSNIGFMRYSYFWDNTPFMNLIWIDELYRGKGIGEQVVTFWAKEMKQQGCELLMTSTLATEDAQHFYRKLGFKDAGCLLLDNEPLEIILTKSI
ncbi:GNAT family N-acetyltransferase [Paenibacillus monticola]|uniref:GNAT family N-acetyltransferase n=1 Tax=Paenibacillus monticola TaxID=2666075 RepID=A0A7X2H8D7_9BACL|nr:GNAT family N-acetyltransferase [Paenibacillus monticola]MRN55421.1 GNAT family N-acetyltransferase [Paenibacillus monticola]